jgi:hypothetical protein
MDGLLEKGVKAHYLMALGSLEHLPPPPRVTHTTQGFEVKESGTFYVGMEI